jgi:hypothetical protein
MFLLSGQLLTGLQLWAQCGVGCTTTLTPANRSNNFTVNLGDVLCVPNGIDANGDWTVNNGGIVHLCGIKSGNFNNFNGGTITVYNGGSFRSNVTIKANATLNIEDGGDYRGNSTVRGTVNMNGTRSGGTLSIENPGVLNIGSTASFSGGNINFNSGTINNYYAGSLAAFNLNGTFNNYADGFTFTGNLQVNGTGSIQNQPGASMAITGNLQNNGNSSFQGPISVGGNFTNQGPLLLGSALNVAGAFNNNNTITGDPNACGTITVGGGFTNNNTLTGTLTVCNSTGTSGGTVGPYVTITNNAATCADINTICSTPLPVDAIRLELDFGSAQGILRWEVINEQQVKGYAIEGRTAQPGATFEQLAFVPAVGAVQRTHVYEASLSKMLTTAELFRIRVVDVDGRSQFSNVVEAQPSTGWRALVAYPSPASFGEKVYVVAQPDAQLWVADMQGRKIPLPAVAITQGFDPADLGLAPGVYTILCQTPTGWQSTRLVINQ